MSASSTIPAQQPPAQKSVVGKRSSPWIVAPVADLPLIVATPLLVWCGLSLAQRIWTAGQITSFALIWAIGHHLPGLMRAYGDRALFQRFKLRFLLAPLLLVAVGVYASVTQSNAILLGVGFWGLWHYLMQSYGFFRIYDSKMRSVAPLTCWLDQAMCLIWFLGALILTDNGLFGDLNRFYKAGGPVISPQAIIWLQQAMIAALCTVTFLFAGNAIWRSIHGDPPSPVKLALMAITFGFYWYCLATVSNLLVSYALFELFHDVQYLTIVWSFNARRAEKDAGAGAFTRYLFRKRRGLIAGYLGLIILYGCLNYGTRQWVDGPLQKVLLGLFVASTVLHYYYDGFIWKLRETDTRKSLGLADEVSSRSKSLGFAVKWTLAAVPLCGLAWLAVRETQHPEFGIEKHDALVATLPRCVFARRNRGIALAAMGDLETAEAEFRRALDLNPHYFEIHYDLGTVLLRKGDKNAASTEFQLTLNHDRRHLEANYNLGVLNLERGRYREALPLFEMAVRLAPRRAEIQSSLGSALFMAHRNRDAIASFRRALELNPNLIETHGSLAEALVAVNDVAGAESHYRKAVELQPDSAIVHFNLGVFLDQQQKLDAAIDSYRRSLKIDPKSGTVWNNLGVALAKQNKLKLGVDAFQKAVELDPKNTSAIQNLEQAKELLQGSK
ncbi:MAG: hypothetical protein JWM11_1022 [Planctomycetaceae bacterium]|nr:hypothetical protein [Planctomycetaceae bacterium]